MKKLILLSLFLAPSSLLADRLGSLKSNADVLLTTQATGGGVTVYNATSTIGAPLGITASTGVFTSSVTASSFFGDGSHLTGVAISSSILFGYISVVHKDGTRTIYTPSANTDVARGASLYSASTNAVNGDIFYLSVSTFDLVNYGIDLSLGNTGGISIHGSGKYNTVILSQLGFPSPIIIPGTNSELTDLSLIANSGYAQIPYGHNSIGGSTKINNALIRNVYIFGYSDGIYLSGSTFTPLDITVKNTTISSLWDCINMNVQGRINIYDSDLKATATSDINSGHVARPIRSTAGTIYSYNNFISASGGDQQNYAYNTNVDGSLYVFGGTVTTSGTSPFDLINEGASSFIGVTANTVYDTTKKSGKINYLDSNQIATSLSNATIPVIFLSTVTASYGIFIGTTASITAYETNEDPFDPLISVKVHADQLVVASTNPLFNPSILFMSTSGTSMSQITASPGGTFGLPSGNGSNGQYLKTDGSGNTSWSTVSGGGGSSTLAVGTGSASNFTNNITSPTAAISFLGDQFKSVANGTTNFMILNQSSVTLQGQSVLSLSSASSTYFPIVSSTTLLTTSSATSTYQPIGSYLTTSSASATYFPLISSTTLLTTSSASATYFPLISSTTLLTTSSASATYFPLISSTTLLTASSATATYINKYGNGSTLSGLPTLSTFTVGDMFYANTTTGVARIPPNTTGTLKFLTQIVSTLPTWQTVPTAGSYMYFLSSNTSGGSELMVNSGVPTTVVARTVSGVTTDVIVSTWITPTGQPNLTSIPAGLWSMHLDAYKSGGLKDLSFYAKVYKYNGTTHTLLFQFQDTEFVTFTSTIATQELDVDYLASQISISTTDRIEMVVYAKSSGSGLDPSGGINYQGATDGRLQLPSNIVDATNFVPYTGATADVNLNNHSLSTTYGVGASTLNVTGQSTIVGPTYFNATTSYPSGGASANRYQFNGSNTVADSSLSIWNWSSTAANSPSLFIGHSKSNTIGTHTTLASGDRVGNISFQGSDGTNFNSSGYIRSEVDAAVSANVVPGRMTFATANGAGTAVETIRINSSQNVGISTTAPITKLAVAGDGTFTSSVTANSFYGDGSNLTGIRVPYGSNPTVNSDGMIAQDTTGNQIVYGSQASVLSSTHQVCMSIQAVTAADDGVLFYLADRDVTFTSVGCKYVGTGSTTATFALKVDNNTSMTHTSPTCTATTAAATFQDITANGAVTAGHDVTFDVTNTPNPATDNYIICADYKEDRK